MSYLQNAARELETILSGREVRIFAVETSCDETAAAVVQNGRVILSSAIFSQIGLHKAYGGVVPEIASRSHAEKICLVADSALKDAAMDFDGVDAIAVTSGPGLVGALLVGVSYAKGLAFALSKPLVAIHHIESHICANYLTHPQLDPPFACLVASGGHSHIFYVGEDDSYSLLGCSQDDAAGEAFDKAARLLSLPYPGGPGLDDLAEDGDENAFRLPVPRTAGRYDFSFSGLKTAFAGIVRKMQANPEALPRADLAAVFRKAVVGALVDKTVLAAKENGIPVIALAGGVSANRLLRKRMREACDANRIRLYMPAPELCGDNAAMVGAAAYRKLKRGQIDGLSLNASPSIRLA